MTPPDTHLQVGSLLFEGRPKLNGASEPSDQKENAIASHRRAAETSFFWAMRLLPVQRRKAAHAVYNFYREIDDIADGEASPSLKQVLLMNWRSEIARLYGGQPRHAVTLGLSEAINAYNLSCRDFLAIIDGAEMKAQTDIRAPSFAQLDRYCECIAVALSRLLLRIFGDGTPAGERAAEQLGRAVQFTNILHDLAADAKRYRLFLPRGLLHAHGIFATMPSWVLAQPGLPEVCRDFALRAECHYAAAAEAIAACSPSAMRPAAVMLGIHRALFDALLARGWRRLDEPVQIPLMRELALVLRHGLTGR
jgi:presqualene diphosphate synthase